MSDSTLGRFGHHPDPVIDFEVEVDFIEALDYDVSIGFGDRDALERHVDNALLFRVGGDPRAVTAKGRVRRVQAGLEWNR